MVRIGRLPSNQAIEIYAWKDNPRIIYYNILETEYDKYIVCEYSSLYDCDTMAT